MDEIQAPGGNRWHPAWLIALGAGLAVLYAPTAAWLWNGWMSSLRDNAHGVFIPLLSGYFAWEALKPLGTRPRESSAWGLAFVVPALAVHAVATGLGAPLASAASIVLLLPGLSLLLLGPARTRAIAFPLAFLIFMLPIPPEATAHLHLVLRRVTTVASAAIVPLLGIQVFAEGTTLHLANATLEVADACSGYSTLYASIVLALLTSYFCRTWRRRALVLLASVPIAICVNILRVVALVLLVHWQGSDVLATSLHETSGLVIFGLALLIIYRLGDEREASGRTA